MSEAPLTYSSQVNDARTNLIGLNQTDMEAFFAQLGEKRFRATQVLKWIHQQNTSRFDAMSNIGKALQQQLEQVATICPPEVIMDQLSSDGTRKWVLGLADGNRVETVFIPDDDRGTLCISSQVGCALDCSFCSTARQGFNRNLTSDEIIAQVWLATRLLNEEQRPGRIITNVVFMGMGEPLLNFDNVMRAIDLLLDDNAYGLSKRRVTISTAGVVPGIDRLVERVPVQLAISLHATDDALRNELVPLNRKYPLNQLISACRRFMEKQPQRSRLTIEYVMLDGVNDTDHHARKLIQVLKDIPVLVNLIPFNPFPESGYGTSSPERVKQFQTILMNAGVLTVIRRTRGDDIDAACGQLVGKVSDKSRRHKKFESPRFGMNT